MRSSKDPPPITARIKHAKWDVAVDTVEADSGAACPQPVQVRKSPRVTNPPLTGLPPSILLSPSTESHTEKPEVDSENASKTSTSQRLLLDGLLSGAVPHNGSRERRGCLGEISLKLFKQLLAKIIRGGNVEAGDHQKPPRAVWHKLNFTLAQTPLVFDSALANAFGTL